MTRSARAARRRAVLVALFAVVVLVLGVGLPLGAAGVVRAAAARAVTAVGDVLLVKGETEDDGGAKDSGKKDGGSGDCGRRTAGRKDAGKKDAGKKDAGKKDAGGRTAARRTRRRRRTGCDQFQGRDQIGEASAKEYVDIQDVAAEGNILAGGDFSGGSYSFSCSLSDHHNSDNPIIAPGKRNGAQHVHDYAGNDSTNAASNLEVLEGVQHHLHQRRPVADLLAGAARPAPGRARRRAGRREPRRQRRVVRRADLGGLHLPRARQPRDGGDAAEHDDGDRVGEGRHGRRQGRQRQVHLLRASGTG